MFSFLFLLLFCSISAQRINDSDALIFRDADDLFADDYGNIYVYKNKDFSLTKYDSLGFQLGKLMFTLPFKIQSVQNPLNIAAFSENAQELRFFDQNLNEIQTLNFRQKFGYIKMVYAEDQQQLWLLEESSKRLVQYNFRENRVINSFPFNIEFDNIIDLIVYENRAYILSSNKISTYDFQGKRLSETALTNPRKLRRENANVLIVQKSNVSILKDAVLENIFNADEAQIVDKNSNSYFEIRGNKLYLYRIKN